MNRNIRSMLFCPANNPRFYHTAPCYKPDCIIFDLEDSVPHSEKDAARNMLIEAFKDLTFEGIEIFVRVNSFKSSFFNKDITAVIKAGIKNIRIPMCESADEIASAHKVISEIEKKYNTEPNSIKIQAGIETPLGLMNVKDIINASDRIVALSFGAEDYTAHLGIDRTKKGDEILYARNVLITAASAYGLLFTDAVYKDINDADGFTDEVTRMKSLGVFSKSLIHPSQVDLLHEALKPTAEQVSSAKRILNASKNANINDGGVITLDGKMVDVPVIKKARKILDLSERD